MDNKYKIIERLAKEQKVEEIARNLSGKTKEDINDVKDLIQEVYINLLSKSEELINELDRTNSFNFYIQKMLWNNMYSQNSPYYYKYKYHKKKKARLYDSTATRDDID